jgi:hypothetical protein
LQRLADVAAGTAEHVVEEPGEPPIGQTLVGPTIDPSTAVTNPSRQGAQPNPSSTGLRREAPRTSMPAAHRASAFAPDAVTSAPQNRSRGGIET